MMWYLFGAYIGRDNLMRLPNDDLQSGIQDLIERLRQVDQASPDLPQPADTFATRRFKTNACQCVGSVSTRSSSGT
jgi:hypothetical protein